MIDIQGFPPISQSDAQILILGSMPGVASLNQHQYYGHPRNQFWPILFQLLQQTSVPESYSARRQLLLNHHIALWDVIKSCQRPGSLDSAIQPESIIVNDFESFFAAHPLIRHVIFNGGTAEKLFKQKVIPSLSNHHSMHYLRLPSTSPAYAGMTTIAKREHWQVIVPLIKKEVCDFVLN